MLPDYTQRVSGFVVTSRLRVRPSGSQSVLVWRNGHESWAWSVIGWTAKGTAWRRLTGYAMTQPQALALGLANLETFSR